MKLSTGEWRLFLLSDCIKYFPDVRDHTEDLRRAGKDDILSITKEDSGELNEFLSEDDVFRIRNMLRKEWRFTGSVKDNGRNNKTICEYCQFQHIRYRYLCRNDKTNNWLSLGSVCVGNVVYGEDKMKDKDFKEQVIQRVESHKSSASADMAVREEQGELIKLCVQYLQRRGVYVRDDSFLLSLQRQWHQGKTLTAGQLEHLKNKCREAKRNEGLGI